MIALTDFNRAARKDGGVEQRGKSEKNKKEEEVYNAESEEELGDQTAEATGPLTPLLSFSRPTFIS